MPLPGEHLQFDRGQGHEICEKSYRLGSHCNWSGFRMPSYGIYVSQLDHLQDVVLAFSISILKI